jgi:hypothetical protein
MRTAAKALMVAGILQGCASLALLVAGWWDLAPYVLMFAGATLIVAAAVGASGRDTSL